MWMEKTVVYSLLTAIFYLPVEWMKSINLFAGYHSSDLSFDFFILIESIKFIPLHFLDEITGYETI